MHYAGNSGASHETRGPAISELFAHFPGRVAVAHDDLGLGRMATWQHEGVDDTPWALEALYDRGTDFLLVVRTVRSETGLNARGLPVESHALQVSNFLGRAMVIANPEHYGPGHHPHRREHLDRYQTAQQAVDHAVPETVTVPCDGVPHIATRITVSDCSVVRVSWDDSTVWCTGRPDIVARLVLRSAILDDFRAADTE